MPKKTPAPKKPGAAKPKAPSKVATVRFFDGGHGIESGLCRAAWRDDERARLVLPAGFDQPKRRPARHELADQASAVLKQL